MNLRVPEAETEQIQEDTRSDASSSLRIAMIGAGYVGLVSGVCLAKLGFEVCCLDINAKRVDALTRGEIPIFEPGLDTLVRSEVRAGRLSFGGFTPEAIARADLIFLAVGTPSRPGSDEADLTYVFDAARMVAPHLKAGAVVVVKSTVPVGTNQALCSTIEELRPELHFSVVSNPEFLREGRAIDDFLHPDRIVVGFHDAAGRRAMARVYRSFEAQGVPVLFTSLENAELIKYAANAFLAMKVAFANELSDLCEAAGGDVRDVVQGIGLDARIGPRFLQPGPGFGGSCFPKDTRAYAELGRKLKTPQRLIETVVEVNEERKENLAARVASALGGSCAGKTIAILGVAFKPDTDDVREAPSLRLIPALVQAGADVRYYDPQVAADAVPELKGARGASSLAAALEGADAAVLLTEWAEFGLLDLPSARQSMRGATFIDFRNLYAQEAMERAGFLYHPVGRSPSSEAAHPPGHMHPALREYRPADERQLAIG